MSWFLTSRFICVLYMLLCTVNVSQSQLQVCFAFLPDEVQIQENIEVGSTVYTHDLSLTEDVSYNVLFDPPIGSDYFACDLRFDLLVTTKSALDYEMYKHFKIIFEVFVEVNDRKKRAVETDCYISINITDVPEAPVFLDNVYEIEVYEGAAGTNLTGATTYIFDPDEEDIINFSIKTPNSPFLIDSHSAILSFASDYSIDRNVNAEVAFVTLEATDSTGLSDEAHMIVTILNVNDNAPKFSLTDVTVYLSSQTPINAEIQNMVATDADGDIIEYTIEEEETEGHFMLDQSKVKLIKELDTEEPIIVYVIAQDGEWRSTATVTVSILNGDSITASTEQLSNEASNDNSCTTSNASLSWVIPLVLAISTAALLGIIPFLCRKTKKSQEEEGDKVIPIAEDVLPVEA